MSRGFGTTYGTGATDIIQTSYNTAPTTLMSYSLWAFAKSAGIGTSFSFLFSNLNTLATLNAGLLFYGLSTTLDFTVSWSGNSNTADWNFPAPSLNAWHHIGITYNGSSTSNNPLIYVDGVLKTLTRINAPSGTIRQGSQIYALGDTLGIANPFDGKLAEFSVWNGSILNASEILALSKGISPFFIRPSGLSLYLPLNGAQSGEADWGPSRSIQTLSGTVGQPHAPVSFLTPLNSSLLFPFAPPPSVLGPSSYKRLYLPKLRTRASI